MSCLGKVRYFCRAISSLYDTIHSVDSGGASRFQEARIR